MYIKTVEGIIHNDKIKVITVLKRPQILKLQNSDLIVVRFRESRILLRISNLRWRRYKSRKYRFAVVNAADENYIVYT